MRKMEGRLSRSLERTKFDLEPFYERPFRTQDRRRRPRYGLDLFYNRDLEALDLPVPRTSRSRELARPDLRPFMSNNVDPVDFDFRDLPSKTILDPLRFDFQDVTPRTSSVLERRDQHCETFLL